MIQFEKIEKRKYKIFDVDVEQNKQREIIQLNLIFSPASNKFDKIIDYVEDCSKVLGNEFDEWFKSYLNEYIDSNYDAAIIKKHIPKLMELSDKYLEVCDVNFEDYVNKDKISKNSIFFDDVEIKKLIQASNYLKLYFIISQDSVMKLPVKFHREIYNILVKEISEKNILFKLFKIVSSKTYRYNLTDSHMWEFIKSLYCKTTDMHIQEIFNFLVNNILVACEPKSNPIPFMISVVDEAIRWILQSVYKDSIVYSETINTEDAYIQQGKDKLKTYAYNDTIGKLVLLAYSCLESHEISDITFNESIKKNKETSLFSTYITYPVLSKVLDIPFRHFTTIPTEHGYLLNVLLYSYFPEEFKSKYSTICELLLHYNKEKSIPKTTYKIKNIDHLLKTKGKFLGFKNIIFASEFYSKIIGKISRNTYVSFKDEKELINFPLAKLEEEMIEFYNDYFDNRLQNMYEQIEDELDRVI